MTVTEITTLLSALAAFITSVAGVYVSVKNSTKIDVQHNLSIDNAKKIEENTTLTKESARKIDEVHQATDAIKAATGSTDVSILRANQPIDKGAS